MQNQEFKILLVDDSALMRQFVSRALDMTGHELVILQARDGNEGLRIAREVRPDLIITDIHMPVADGEDLICNLESEPELKAVPVVVLTADSERHRADSLSRHASVLECLHKPIRPEELRRVLEQLVPRFVESSHE